MINGSHLKNAIISGANNIYNYKEQINEMNIFPVPDGDTGTNMSMTICSAAKDLANLENNDISKVAKEAAGLMLRNARGNSGVILSILFKGFAKGLEGLEEADAMQLMKALKLGVESAYSAVANPTEGTILTVARIACEEGRLFAENKNDSLAVWKAVFAGARDALAQTPEFLPVLKKAGVVDAGGEGFVKIMQGFKSFICDGKIIEKKNTADIKDIKNDDFFKNAAAEFDQDINFTYCTEFIVEKKPDLNFDSNKFSKLLQKIGDCVVVVDDEKIIKTHVHTESPGTVLQEGLKFGELITVKVENMKQQHKNAKLKNEKIKKVDLEKKEPIDKFGFVAVSAGDGLEILFSDLGVNQIVSGGQTMNPSTDDICNAALATGAKTVFVLPNNKNILLAAQQSAKIIKDRKVIVIKTKNIPQGIAAMLAFDQDASEEENLKAMNNAFSNINSGQVTYAARDSEYGGFKIKKGNIIALENGKLSFVEKTANKAALKLTRAMVNSNTSFVTLIWGKEVSSKEAEECYDLIKSKINKDIDVTLVYGGQPIYHYLISVE